MKRREFFRTAGTATVVLSAGSLLSFDLLPVQGEGYPPEELKTALDAYFVDVMAGKYFHPDHILPGNYGRLMIVKSYSLEVIREKNSIFDISDLVIKRLNDAGFDAGSLKEGKIPEGLEVAPGLLRIPNRMFPIKVDELKNYDAVLYLNGYCTVTTKQVPTNWKNITSLKKEELKNGILRYSGKPDFVLMDSGKLAKTMEFRFNVDLSTEQPKINEPLPEMVSAGFIRNLFTPEQLQIIKI